MLTEVILNQSFRDVNPSCLYTGCLAWQLLLPSTTFIKRKKKRERGEFDSILGICSSLKHSTGKQWPQRTSYACLHIVVWVESLVGCPPSWAVGSSWSPGFSFEITHPLHPVSLVSARPKKVINSTTISRWKGLYRLLKSLTSGFSVFDSLWVPSSKKLFGCLLKWYWIRVSEMSTLHAYILVASLGSFYFQAQPLAKEKRSESGVSSIPLLGICSSLKHSTGKQWPQRTFIIVVYSGFIIFICVILPR